MPFTPRAAQELDLLLQEGRADDPLLLDGLVHLYAPELFRFAWALCAPSAENPTVQRLLARRTVTRALTTTLQQIHRFQEQPGTFLWLLRLTCQQANPFPAHYPALARYFTRLNLSPEDIAYILKIPERRAVDLLETEPPAPLVPPPNPAEPVSAGVRAAFTPLTTAETTALLDHLHRLQPAPLPSPRFAREMGLVLLALVLLIGFVRLSPNRVVYLPTPPPPPTATPSAWDITPVPLPTIEAQPSDILYEPENPYLLWQLTHHLQGDPSYISTLAASPTEPLLAIGANNSSLTLWDLTTFTQTQTLEGHTGGIQSLAFSSDGAILASGGADGLVQLWEMPSGHLLQVFDGHPIVVSGLAFSPDGQTLAVAAGKELWFWQVNGGARIATYTTFKQALTSLTYSPDGQLLAVGEGSGTGWLLRAEDAYPLLSFRMSFSMSAQKMLFFPDSRGLVVMSRENLPMILRLEGDANHMEAEIVKTLLQAGEDVYTPAVYDFVLAGDGSFVAASTQGGNVYVWDTATWKPRHAPLMLNDFESSVYPLALANDSRTLVMGRDGGRVAVWQLEDVSGQAGRLYSPRFFQRLESDTQRASYTVTNEEYEVLWGQADLSDLDRVSEEAGFPIRVPMIGLLGGDHEYDTVYYDPASHLVYMSVWARNNPGLLIGFSLRQRQVELGQSLNTLNFPFGTWDTVGLTALVERVPIGLFEGEIMTGNWMFMDEENTGWLGESPQPGDVIAYVNRWSDATGNLSIRWVEGNILYELQAYLDPVVLAENPNPVPVRETLIQLAQTMFSPQELSLPWNLIPFFYEVTRGDTCAALAARFYTTVDVIRRLNRLGATCTLTAGQTLVLPTPAEPYITGDLNCDSQDETILLLRDPTDPTLITGVAMEIVVTSNLVQRIWQTTATEMGVASLNVPELFTIGDCEQLLAVSGGTPTDSRTRVFRWDGDSVWAVLIGRGRPYSSDYSIAALPQDSDTFVIPLIQYVPSTHPAAGPCPNEVTDYTWDGLRFEAGELRLVLGECAGMP